MGKGSVVSIHIADQPTAPTIEVRTAHALPGRGLQGDRYFEKTGTFSDKDGPDRELTLIEIEALEALERECRVTLQPGAARRQIVTRGVALNHLVGREFQVGEVRLRGIRLCEPCSHLARLTQPEVLDGLAHRGGLRAQVLSEGTIRTGDEIT
jgi:MOSC domain-containing protein YiiM